MLYSFPFATLKSEFAVLHAFAQRDVRGDFYRPGLSPQAVYFSEWFGRGRHVDNGQSLCGDSPSYHFENRFGFAFTFLWDVGQDGHARIRYR